MKDDTLLQQEANMLDSYNHGHNVLPPCNCNILAVCDLFEVLLHLGLVHTYEIQFVPLLCFGQGVVLRPELCR